MRYCTKCVTPETQEGIRFDAQGVCLTCRNIEAKRADINWAERRTALNAIARQYANRAQYDCIVPFSGGKDSTYQLLFVIRELGLKPLVVRYDHWGFRPQVAENNRRTFMTLGCDVVQLTVNWHTVRELMRRGIALRGDFCWHCHTGIYGYVMQMAVRFGIPLVFWGEAPWEYTAVASSQDIQELERDYFEQFIGLGLSAEEILADTAPGTLTARDIAPFLFPSREEVARIGLRGVYLGNYIPWDPPAHAAVIKRELGWQGSVVEGIPPEWDYEKVECKWQGVRDWSKFIKRGFGRTNHLVSLEIRKGTMTRERGLEMVARYDGKRPASLDVFLHEIGMTEADFLRWMLPHQVAPWIFDPAACDAGPPLPDMSRW